jgi:glutathione S-transferase
MLKLFNYQASGNCYKARLLLAHLGTPYQAIDIDVSKSKPRSPEFLAKHPSGKVPLLELEDGTCLAESGAILHWLAAGTRFLPTDTLQHHQVLQWMFFEQNSVEPNIATRRYWVAIHGDPTPRQHVLPMWLELGERALAVMDKHLAGREFFAAERYTIADIALYGYVHDAEVGGFELAKFPNVQRWLGRVCEQPGYVPMR